MKSELRDHFLAPLAVIFTILLNFLFAIPSLASLESDLQGQIFNYTSEHAPTFFFSGNSQFQTQSFMGKLKSYYESGPRGAWSFDPNPLRYTLTLSDAGDLIWFGREHPMQLSRPNQIDPYGALGSIWVQNQIHALDPNVDGWIGLGLVKNLGNNFKLNLAYSPLFIPTFGPSLGISDRGELNPARFARTPPTQFSTGGQLYPIHYQIKIDHLSELLLQQQFFTGLSFEDPEYYFDFYAFTAPKPDAVALPEDISLAVNSAVNVDVRVVPQFPREYWSGMQFQAKEILFQPSLELTQNLKVLSIHYLSLTGYMPMEGKSRASFGLLTHLEHQFDSAQLSDLLLFVRIPIALTDQLEFRTLIQTTMQTSKESFYWLNELEYRFNKTFSILGQISILSGVDNSYFGAWRNQDSYSAGVRWLW